MYVCRVERAPRGSGARIGAAEVRAEGLLVVGTVDREGFWISEDGICGGGGVEVGVCGGGELEAWEVGCGRSIDDTVALCEM